MKIKELTFKETKILDEDTLYSAFVGNQRFTVLDRMTGFGWRDIETGYCDNYLAPLESPNMWIATRLDIRNYRELTLTEAVKLIKKKADVCRGEDDPC